MDIFHVHVTQNIYPKYCHSDSNVFIVHFGIGDTADVCSNTLIGSVFIDDVIIHVIYDVCLQGTLYTCITLIHVMLCGCALSVNSLTPGRFQWIVTLVWIHIWWWNDAYSLMLLRRGALLFFKVIHQISRSHGSKNRQIWPRLGKILQTYTIAMQSVSIPQTSDRRHRKQHTNKAKMLNCFPTCILLHNVPV